MAYDTRATLVTRLTAIRTAIDNARNAEAYGIGDRNLRRPNLKSLLDEEKIVLDKIESIDRYSTGFANKVQFQRPV
jgi:hypothetical protein